MARTSRPKTNLIHFPDRGGTGFRAKGKWGDYDFTNVYLPTKIRHVPTVPTFDPHNPAHVAAWEALCRFGQQEER